MKKTLSQDYIPEIDGLRAIAVLAVVIYHLNLFPPFKGGFIGVDVFFVISGYVISRSLYKGAEYGFAAYIGRFYARRIKRILPALAVCLLAAITATILFIPPCWLDESITKTGLSAFLGYSNFTLALDHNRYFSVVGELNPFLHTWSLAVEEQFYLIFPLIYFIWLRHGKKKSAAGFISRIVLPILALASLCFSAWETPAFHDRAFYLLPSRFWELAAGALLSQLHSVRGAIFKSVRLSGVLMPAGLLMIAFTLFSADEWDFPFAWAVLPVLGSLLVINGVCAKQPGSRHLCGILSSPPMVFLGKISYSLYLWHWPVAVLLRWTIGLNTIPLVCLYLAASFALALVSYTFVESPVRKGAFILKQPNWKILIFGAILLAVFFLSAQGIVRSRETLSLSVTKDSYIWRSWRFKCDRPDPPVIPAPEIEGHAVFALGDSHTAAYRTMLNIVSGQLGFEVHEYEAGGCAVANLLKPMNKMDGSWNHYENALSEIKDLAQPGDIVFLASLRMPELSDLFEVLELDPIIEDYFSDESKENRRQALEEADEIITELEALGLTVLIDAPKPVIRVPLYRCSDWFNRNNPIAAPGTSVSRELLLKLRQPVMDSLDALKQRHPALQVWDPFYVLCTDEEFSAYDDNGLPIFYDGDHLSANGNRLLAPSFKDKIIEIWMP
ncbi:MAG: acyltransferase family protein [Spirochaetales bacterium]|nr:acyltransferase family protein [Spirochaetales bacterium]